MTLNRLISCVLLLFLASAPTLNLHAEEDAALVQKGKELFSKNACNSCHAANMKTKLTGPALAGVEERWDNKADLYAWIRNSTAMIEAGHPRAVALWNEYKVKMNLYPNVTDEEIDAMLAYIRFQAAGGAKPAEGDAAATGAAAEPEYTSPNNQLIIGVLFLVLAALAFILSRIVGNLNHLSKVKAGETPGARPTVLEQLTSKTVLGIATFILVVVGAFLTINNAIKLGRQQNYEPEQPINFSHAIHAGKHKIDCQYCHDSARRSKHSSIPGTNTCMNCHAAVKQGEHEKPMDKGASSAEILKIYAASGFNPENGKYFDMDSVTMKDVRKSFSNWLSKVYVDAGVDEKRAASTVKAQVDKAMGMAFKPVEWVRIHNMPDHVYFNHQQHVVAGGLQCQTCHGPVEQMTVLKQYSPLSMGWCINCHREQEVKFADNPYYESFEKYHREIKEGKRSGVTVEEVGGLECQKCHY